MRWVKKIFLLRFRFFSVFVAILSYTDAFAVAEYAIPALQRACGSGVMDGYGNGSLGALDGATRAQTVTILQRYNALKGN